jgi:two-component system phosphate regulon sensor histidine kinase PhoR
LHALIEDLLLLSRVESAKEPLKLEPLELSRILEKMKDMFTPLLREKKLRWEMKITPPDLTIMAEPASMERALSNLLDNAVKYNRPDGRVAVHAFRDGGHVKIQVSDTGSGIVTADLPRIFERFYRADKSRSRELGGSGLGLSISKHIAERHGGRIEVQSVLQEGSTFTLVLPA